MHHELVVATLLVLTMVLSGCGLGAKADASELASFAPPDSLPEALRGSYCDRYLLVHAKEACRSGLQLASQ